MFAISTPSTVPSATAAESAARVVRVNVHLERRVVADDEQRVAHLLERRLERHLIEPVALHDEHRAVAVPRRLLVYRVEPPAPRPRPRRSGSGRGQTEMPRTISTRPAPPASTTPASRRTSSISGVRESASSPRRRAAASVLVRRPAVLPLLRLLGHLADHGQHRPLDRPLDCAIRSVARASERARRPSSRAARSVRARPRSRGRSGRR